MEDLLGFETADLVSTVITISLIGSIGFIILIVLYYVIKNSQANKKRREDDKKLQSYFELYSDVIADKVVKKINEQNK